MTLLSRITGLLRETIKATAFGAGLSMDAFEAAFRLPNLLRRLFGEGAFSQAFVPILAEYRRKRGLEATHALVDPCMLDTFIAVVRYVDGGPAKPWWHYTAERKRVVPGSAKVLAKKRAAAGDSKSAGPKADPQGQGALKPDPRKSVRLKPDPQKHDALVGRPSGRRLSPPASARRPSSDPAEA